MLCHIHNMELPHKVCVHYNYDYDYDYVVHNSEFNLAPCYWIDFVLGDLGGPSDSDHPHDVLQEGDEDGDRLVRLQLCRGAQYTHV